MPRLRRSVNSSGKRIEPHPALRNGPIAMLLQNGRKRGPLFPKPHNSNTHTRAPIPGVDQGQNCYGKFTPNSRENSLMLHGKGCCVGVFRLRGTPFDRSGSAQDDRV
jgi:hypothetical protein